MSLRDVTREMLGEAERITVTPKRTSIVGAKGDPQAVADRIAQLRYYAANTDYEFNRKRHENGWRSSFQVSRSFAWAVRPRLTNGSARCALKTLSTQRVQRAKKV